MPAVMPRQATLARLLQQKISWEPSASQKVKLGRGTPCLFTVFPRDDDRLGERGYVDMRSVCQTLPS